MSSAVSFVVSPSWLVSQGAELYTAPCVSNLKTAVTKGLLLVALTIGAGVGCRSQGPSNMEPVYDKLTGKLQLLKYDSNRNGKIDTWSYMDGTRVLRIEL